MTYPKCSAVYLLWNGIISAYFVNLSMITNIALYVTFVAESLNAGSPVTKSIAMSVYSSSRT
jgi:hypothetical protein